jgi:hypothetical protein
VRSGHTSTVFENKLIIFGGEKCYNRRMRLRECLNDVMFFNMDTHIMSTLKTIGDYVTPRRFHTADIVNSKFFAIYGGIASNEHGLKDIVLLNLGRYF